MTTHELTLFPTTQDFTMLKEIGAMAVRSGLLPSSVKTAEQAVVIALKGREIGIPPMQAFSSIVVVNGKPSMSAELMLAMIYKNVRGAVVNFLTTDAVECVIEAQRPGGKPTRFVFTIEDAKRADLLKNSVWLKYPAAMLRARCISATARAMFPDALSGIVYVPEELGAEVTEDGEVIEVPPGNSYPSKAQEVPESKPPTPAPSLATDSRYEVLNKLSETMKRKKWTSDQVKALSMELFQVDQIRTLEVPQIEKMIGCIETITVVTQESKL